MSSEKKRTTASDFSETYSGRSTKRGPATHRAEQQFQNTRTLNPLVDPSAYGVIRTAVARMEQIGPYWKLLFGLPLPLESTFDTTGSMGGMVDVILEQLPREYDLLIKLLERIGCPYDLQIANGNFNDQKEQPVICRSMFEMGLKIAEQLQYFIPVRAGGDDPEDPHYSIFAGGFLTQSTSDLFGLKGYHFVVTDAPARDMLLRDLLVRIFGDQVFQHAAKNDPQNSLNGFSTDIPSHCAVDKLLQRSHAFVVLVEPITLAVNFWKDLYGSDRVIHLHNARHLPELKTVLVGLTEGILTFDTATEFLIEHGTTPQDTDRIVDACLNIPLPAKMELNAKLLLPKPGDFFKSKLGIEPPTDPQHLVPIPADSIDLRDLVSKPDEKAPTFNW